MISGQKVVGSIPVGPTLENFSMSTQQLIGTWFAELENVQFDEGREGQSLFIYYALDTMKFYQSLLLIAASGTLPLLVANKLYKLYVR